MIETKISKRPRGVVFDCDGVMIDSRSVNIGYYNILLQALGKPPLSKEQEDFAQKSTAHQAVEQVMTEDELARLPQLCIDHPYHEYAMPRLKPMNGFDDFAQWLHRSGVKLAVHTNRGDGIFDVIKYFGWDELFEIVKNVRNSLPKPDPDGAWQILWEWGFEPDEVLFIGDSDTDLSAASQTGMIFVAFQNPYIEADIHVDSFENLKDILLHFFT